MKDGTPLHPLMLAGTGSDVGKSVVAAAFCRIFRQDGYRPAPFKAQNMALNSYATPEGREIGRAQAVQAEAAGLPCHTDMNPLLLKPCTDRTCQVVLHGRPAGNRTARELFGADRGELKREVCAAYDRLAGRYNPIVLEGAGSVSEINLRDKDIVNLPMALHAGADVLLVADIDRGGVFASVYGSVLLLRPEERRLVKGILINKFRGDLELFREGAKMMEDLCGTPVLGIIPYFHDIHIEEEDSVTLSAKHRRAEAGRVNAAVVLLRRLSNFTDFDALERDPRVHLFYTADPAEVEKADIVILPGSKSTAADLEELRRSGLADGVLRAARNGKTVLGICGGYQMMGREIRDPEGVEGGRESVPGLGLLPVVTVLETEKVTRQASFAFRDRPGTCRGYEIHMGRTVPAEGAAPSPLNRFPDGSGDGYVLNDRLMGTYLHGLLDNAAVVDALLAPYLKKEEGAEPGTDYAEFKEAQYDKLADHVRRHVDMDRIYAILKGEG